MARETRPPSARLALSIDFRLQATQDMIGGGSFTIGGFSFSTINEGAAAVLDVLNGTGLRVHPDATATTMGRPGHSSFTCPAIKMAGLGTQLVAPGRRILAVLTKLHFDASSADAASEFAGTALQDLQATTFIQSYGIGHDGGNIRILGIRDTSTGVLSLAADPGHAGTNAVVATIGTGTWANAFTGEAVGGSMPTFAAMTQRMRSTSNANPVAGRLLDPENLDFFLWAQSGNTAGNYVPTFKRLEIYVAEVVLP